MLIIIILFSFFLIFYTCKGNYFSKTLHNRESISPIWYNTKYNLQMNAILCIIFYIKSDYIRLSATFFTTRVHTMPTQRISMELCQALYLIALTACLALDLLLWRSTHLTYRVQPIFRFRVIVEAVLLLLLVTLTTYLHVDKYTH
jgi:hypothetical protein